MFDVNQHLNYFLQAFSKPVQLIKMMDWLRLKTNIETKTDKDAVKLKLTIVKICAHATNKYKHEEQIK